MDGTIRVLLYVHDRQDAPGSVEATYHAVSRALHGTPGLVGNELLRSVQQPSAFAVLSQWSGLDAFLAWQQGPHHDTTAPLRPLQDSTMANAFGIYQVVASH